MKNKTKVLILFLGYTFLAANATTKYEEPQLENHHVDKFQKRLPYPIHPSVAIAGRSLHTNSPQLEYRLLRKRSIDYIPRESCQKRQMGAPNQQAMHQALTNNPVGQPQFGHLTLRNGHFDDFRNFGGRVGGSAGVKVWESQTGQQSAGLGLAAEANTGLKNGSPYANSPQVGAGLGYRNGAFSATAGVNHGYQNSFQRKPSTSYDFGIGYRF